MLGKAARRGVQLVRAAPPKFVVALGWLAVVVYGYPGQMTEASFAYLRQARGRLGSDGGTATVWRLCEVFVAGPSGMLFVQAALFVIGVYAILSRVLTARGAAWSAAGLAVFPPVLASLAVISTHAMMVGWLLVGVACLVAERPRRVLGLGALAIATAVQPTALAATLPLIATLFVWQGERRRVGHALVAWAVITLAAFGADALLGRGKLHAWNFARASSAEVHAPGLDEQLWLTAWHADLVVPATPPPDVALRAGVPTRTSELQDHARCGVSALAGYTPLFMPALYVALALVLVAAARRQPYVRALVASGIVFELFAIVTATSADYRNALWLVVSVCLGGVLFAAQRRRA